MIEGDRPDGVVQLQVVFVRRIVALPAHHVIWRVFILALVDVPDVFVVYLNSLRCTFHGSCLSSNQAVGYSKSPGLARPFAPMGPS